MYPLFDYVPGNDERSTEKYDRGDAKRTVFPSGLPVIVSYPLTIDVNYANDSGYNTYTRIVYYVYMYII